VSYIVTMTYNYELCPRRTPNVRILPSHQSSDHDGTRCWKQYTIYCRVTAKRNGSPSLVLTLIQTGLHIRQTNLYALMVNFRY